MKAEFVNCASVALAAIGLASGTAQCSADVTWSFAKVADTSTSLPGGGTVSSFDSPTFDGSNLAFTGALAGGSSRALFMAGPRGIERFVTTGSTSIPNAGVVFNRFETPVIDNGRIVFVGGGSNAGGTVTREGLYLLEPHYNDVQVVADTSMIAPGTSQTFTEFEFRGQPSVDGQNVAFSAGHTGSFGGVYLKTPANGIQTVANQSTPIPGRGTNFLFFSKVDTENGAVVFQGGRGTGGFNGVYTNLGGTLRTVASDITTMPNGFPFGTEGSTHRGHTLSNGKIQFYGNSGGEYGVWTEQSPGNFHTVAQAGATPVPGYGVIQGMANQAYDNGNSIVGATHDRIAYGLYSDINGQLEPIAYHGAVLDGKTLTSASIVPGSYRGRGVAFVARFNDGTEALYVGTSSAPPADAVLKPFTSGDVLDAQPRNGAGDTVGNRRIIQRLAAGDEYRALAEYNLVDYAGVDLQSVTLDGVIDTNNHFNTGTRLIGVEVYDADGIVRNEDFSLTSVLAGQISHDPALDSTTEFHIDLTDEIEALLGAGRTKIGVRFTPLNDQAASVISGAALPTLSVVVPEPASAIGAGVLLLSASLRRRRAARSH